MTAVPISMLLGARAARREQRKRRAELAGEMMHAEIGAVGAELLGRDRELDRLQQRVGRRAHLRLRRRGPMAEGEEADVFHGRPERNNTERSVSRSINRENFL